MAAHRGKKSKKMGRFARGIARIERRSLRIMMIPVILVAQRRMMRGLERIA